MGLVAANPTLVFEASSGVLLTNQRPNPPLNSDPACLAFRSLSASSVLGFAQRPRAGGSG